jgi:hypothetical protein
MEIGRELGFNTNVTPGSIVAELGPEILVDRAFAKTLVT